MQVQSSQITAKWCDSIIHLLSYLYYVNTSVVLVVSQIIS